MTDQNAGVHAVGKGRPRGARRHLDHSGELAGLFIVLGVKDRDALRVKPAGIVVVIGIGRLRVGALDRVTACVLLIAGSSDHGNDGLRSA